jgi:hypothetical protein
MENFSKFESKVFFFQPTLESEISGKDLNEILVETSRKLKSREDIYSNYAQVFNLNEDPKIFYIYIPDQNEKLIFSLPS